MKKPLLHTLKQVLLLSIVITHFAHAKQITIETDEMWSKNGGVFHSSDQAIPLDVDVILVKDAKGQIRVQRNNQTPSQQNSMTNFAIVVDRTPPTINIQWSDVLSTNNKVKVGADSVLHVTVDEGTVENIQSGANVNSEGNTATVQGFNPNSKLVIIKASDSFGNVSESKLAFETDFQAPDVQWELLSPAIKNNGTWFATNKAKLKLHLSDDSGVDVVTINNYEVVDYRNAINANSGDQLAVIDKLGNQFEQHLSWQEDNDAPYLLIKQGDAKLNNGKSISTRVNQVFELDVQDDGVGIATKTYKGKNRHWQPLPKKFRFLNKGNYRINVKLEDQVGNVLEKSINIKVKR